MLQNPQKNAQKSPYALKHGTARVCARVRPRIMRACVCASRVRYGACACMRARVCTPASARRPAYARVCPRRPAYARVYARVCPRARGVRASALRVSACVCARRVCLRACARRACLRGPACPCARMPALAQRAPAYACPRAARLRAYAARPCPRAARLPTRSARLPAYAYARVYAQAPLRGAYARVYARTLYLWYRAAV